MTPSRFRQAFPIVATLFVVSAWSHDPVVAPDHRLPAGDVPLHDGLGELTYPVSTQDPLAQRYFDQGLRLSYAFHHAEALRSFRAAQRLDPSCAMCFWGEALVLGPNINAGMSADAVDPVAVAVRRAMALAQDPRERLLVDALAQRYSNEPQVDRNTLNLGYADAMEAAFNSYPDDPEISVRYVQALMNTSPWDYWEADGKTPKGRIGEALRVLEITLHRYPDHPGAIHYYIHLTEASSVPERAEPYADRLAALMPAAGHVVHMPSHVYFRMGRYRDSAATNQEAVRADERAFDKMTVYPIYRNGYYPHNIHFVIASAQMAGDQTTALEYARMLEGKIDTEAAATIGWVQRILAVPYFAYVQFSAPEAVLAIPDPGDRFPYVKAMWHYVRAIAQVRRGDLESARSETAEIDRLERTNTFSMMLAWGVPAPDILHIAYDVAQGYIAQSERDTNRAIQAFRSAVTIQDALPYMEPPYWYYPVRQSLGAALLAAGRNHEAVAVLEDSLSRYPNNAKTLEVLSQVQTAAGLGEIATSGPTESRARAAIAVTQ